jgi:hypothetical protein
LAQAANRFNWKTLMVIPLSYSNPRASSGSPRQPRSPYAETRDEEDVECGLRRQWELKRKLTRGRSNARSDLETL